MPPNRDAAHRLELLQITLIVRDLEAAARRFETSLGLRVAFRDPSVERWGLENVVLPMGTTFIEILSPRRGDSPGGRHLARQGGDGGYMVILQTRDLEPWRARMETLGVRIAFEAETVEAEDGQDWAGLHLHPADTGGMMISLDRPDPPDSWAGAGPHWRDFVVRDVVQGLEGIVLRSGDPGGLAKRWAEVLARDVGEGGIELDRGSIGFRECERGEAEGLASVRLRATDRARVGERLHLGGVEFELT